MESQIVHLFDLGCSMMRKNCTNESLFGYLIAVFDLINERSVSRISFLPSKGTQLFGIFSKSHKTVDKLDKEKV